jgi:hypothetical protein
MEWLDDLNDGGDHSGAGGDEEATTRMRVKGDALARQEGPPGEVKAKVRMRATSGALARRELAFKTEVEDRAHQKSCTSKACPWCKYLTFQTKWGSHFRMLETDGTQRSGSLDKKQRAIASMSWLGKAHAPDGEVMLGCVACHALGAKALGNPLGCYLVPAARLIQSGGKPHVLLRHTTAKLHTHAVAKFLGLQGSASCAKFVGRHLFCLAALQKLCICELPRVAICTLVRHHGRPTHRRVPDRLGQPRGRAAMPARHRHDWQREASLQDERVPL